MSGDRASCYRSHIYRVLGVLAAVLLNVALVLSGPVFVHADEIVNNPALEPLALTENDRYEPGVVLVEINEALSFKDFGDYLALIPGIDLDVAPEQFSELWYRVRLKADAQVEDVVNAINDLGGMLEAQPNYALEMNVQLTPADFHALLARASKVDQVTAVPPEQSEPALLAQAVSPNDPLVPNQWALESMKLPEAWELVKTNRSVTVALMDVGCDIKHEDLAGNVVASYNSVENKLNSNIDDMTGHGTHIAGIVSAVSDNAVGVSGISYNAQILPIKVVASDGKAYSQSLIRAYDFVIRHKNEYNIRVINLSMGTKGNPETYRKYGLLDKIDEAFNEGILTVASAGNAQSATPPYQNYPGDYRTVISTISLQVDDDNTHTISASSNYNAAGENSKNISAPGVEILSTYVSNSTLYGGRYGTLSGTSMAAPHVAAVLALEFAANPDLTAAQARDVLYSTTTDLYEPGFDALSGWGLANAFDAVRGAQSFIDGSELLVLGEQASYSVQGDIATARFSSSDPSVLRIDADGQAEALSAGTITIFAECTSTAAASDDASSWSLVKQVTVVEPSITGPTSLNVGKSASYSMSPVMQRDWLWSVSDGTKAGIDATTGRLSALSLGKLVVTARLATNERVSVSLELTINEPTRPMYRLYNPNSGEHFYTANAYERDVCKGVGWRYEGIGWHAPVSSKTPVYRLYNPNAGDHHYTLNKAERDMLVGVGWRYEGIGWYSAEGPGRSPLWRQYNPNAKTGTHNHTLSVVERDHLVGLGWKDEGISWYGYAQATLS